jgi:hypothetical protein
MKKRYANTGEKGAKRYWRIGPALLAKLEQERQEMFWTYCRHLITRAVADGTPRKKAIGDLADRLEISASKLDKMTTKKTLDRQVERQRSRSRIREMRRYKIDPRSPEFIRRLLGSAAFDELPPSEPFPPIEPPEL